MSSSEVVQLVAVVREQTCRFIATLPNQPQTLPEMPPMITDGEGLYETNLRLVLRYLKHVNKLCKRQGALDSSNGLLHQRAIVKQIHDMDHGLAKLSLPFEIPAGVKAVAEKVETSEALRQSLNASWPTNYTSTTSTTQSTTTSSHLLDASECKNETSMNTVPLMPDGGREGTTAASYTVAVEGHVPNPPVTDKFVENTQDATSKVDNIAPIEACLKENASIDGEIAFRFEGESAEIPLSRSPPSELQKFRFRHASDSYPQKPRDIDSYTPQDRAVSLPTRCEHPMPPCFLRWSGETLGEFICDVEVDDVKLYNKVRWLALLQEPEAAAFLGRWPSPATLKDFMQKHHLEWVVRVRGKWDWESKMANRVPANCNAISTNQPSVTSYTDNSVDQDGLDSVSVEDSVGKESKHKDLTPGGLENVSVEDSVEKDGKHKDLTPAGLENVSMEDSIEEGGENSYFTPPALESVSMEDSVEEDSENRVLSPAALVQESPQGETTNDETTNDETTNDETTNDETTNDETTNDETTN
ncbi:hypothetical protein CLAIMM_15048, partial [Cladophialophora immunda]